MRKINYSRKIDFDEERDEMSTSRNLFYLKKFTDWFPNISKDIKIIDIGAGSGVLLNELYKRGFKNLYALDIKNNIKKEYKSKIKFIRMDLNDEPFNLNEKFDLIFCCNVLEHLCDPLSVVGKLISICKNSLFIAVPRELNIFLRLRLLLYLARAPDPYIVGQHIKFFEPEDIKKLPKIFKNIKIKNLIYRGMGLGKLDSILPTISPFLANLTPNLFAGVIVFALKK